MARERAKEIETKSTSFNVFISWSGTTSRAIAEALRALITNVFQDVKAFVSSNDIDAGSNWFGRISTELSTTEFGIVCLTQENLASQWIHFESGALAKKIGDRTRVVPYLYGVTTSDISPPLSLFHCASTDRQGTLALIKSLNSVRANSFEEARLEQIYDKWIDEFLQNLAKIPAPIPGQAPKRSERDLLEEVLARMKGAQDFDRTNLVIQDKKLDKIALMVQVSLKIADVKLSQLQESDGYKKTLYDNVLYLLDEQIRNLKYHVG